MVPFILQPDPPETPTLVKHRDILAEAAGAFVTPHSLPNKDQTRLVDAALKRLEKAKRANK